MDCLIEVLPTSCRLLDISQNRITYSLLGDFTIAFIQIHYLECLLVVVVRPRLGNGAVKKVSGVVGFVCFFS